LALLSRWPIRVKFLVGLGLLLLLVAILSSSGLYATYAYRGLVKSVSWRAGELPLAAELNRQVSDLRIRLGELRGIRVPAEGRPGDDPAAAGRPPPVRSRAVGGQFRTGLDEVQQTLARYRKQLEQEHNLPRPAVIADNHPEWSAVFQLESVLEGIRQFDLDAGWILDGVKADRLEAQVERLQSLSAQLPSHFHQRMVNLADEVRAQYRTLIVGTWIATASAALICLLFVRLAYAWIFRPLRILIHGSRLVASGSFGHRIRLETADEMAELAAALNDMTARFHAIRDDLDRQVQERTKQVVRSEQMASVGFLAAGVAHEINNPLASIAICAESLEDRIREALHDPGAGPVPAPPAGAGASPAVPGGPGVSPGADSDQRAVIAQYLRMIQSEAFRCKEITEKLLDFSRTGQATRQNTELGELVRGVIEIVGHLGKHRHKRIELTCSGPVIAAVNPQEMKQVVLNLLTNALDSLESGGRVWVGLSGQAGRVELAVRDDGCGMTADVLDHVFEPFFTRRREGQGTGLGLSIAYRIIADHGGEIEAESPGPGRGATFRVRLPLADLSQESSHQYRAA
jgi:signal transduction histidine kinase